MAASKERSWKEEIHCRLKTRNRKQSESYTALIHAHNHLFEHANTLRAQNVQLTVEAQKLREENLDLHGRGGGGGGGGGGGAGGSNERVQALEQKLFKLQEELTELHRKRGENAQQIINLNASLQDKEKELNLRESKLMDSEVTILGMRAALKNLEQTILELQATNQMLKDEHQALQLAYTSQEDKIHKLQIDNTDLIKRWMEHKSQEADRINDINALDRKKKQDQMKDELIMAAKDPIHVPIVDTMSAGFLSFCVTTLPNRAKLKIDAHDGEVRACRWSPSGRLLATGGDKKLKLWEIRNDVCELKAVLAGSNAAITSVEFDEQENYVLGASSDFASRVWSLSSGRLQHTLTGHSDSVLGAKFLGESRKVVSGSRDRTLKQWDLVSKACIKTLFAGSCCNDLVTTNMHNVISGHFDKRIRFWDFRSDSSGSEIGLQGRVTSLDITADSYTLLACTKDDNMIKIIDLRQNQVITSLCADGFKVGFDWNRAVFSPGAEYVASGSHDGTVFIWNVAKGKVERTLKEHSHAVIACTWGSYLISGDKQKKVILWTDI